MSNFPLIVTPVSLFLYDVGFFKIKNVPETIPKDNNEYKICFLFLIKAFLKPFLLYQKYPNGKNTIAQNILNHSEKERKWFRSLISSDFLNINNEL